MRATSTPRFQKPSETDQFPNEYDLPTDLIQDQIQRQQAPIRTFIINQAAAGVKEIDYPGRAFAVFSYTGGVVNANPAIQIAINENYPDRTVVPQDSRGFRGSFYRLFLNWPLIANTTTYLVIFESSEDPFVRFA